MCVYMLARVIFLTRIKKIAAARDEREDARGRGQRRVTPTAGRGNLNGGPRLQNQSGAEISLHTLLL
jgi:hypothetical protein